MRMPAWLRTGIFVVLVSTIVVTASELLYWYTPGLTVPSLLELVAFYAVPTAAGLWAMARTPARRLHQVVLAGAAYAFVVEGVLTTVIYGDGPLPVLASLFVGWHGVLAFTVFWYLFHRWIVDGDRRRLLVAAGGIGAGWGLWALVVSALDPAVSGGIVATPGSFALYAAAVTVLLAAAHRLAAAVLPEPGWRPSPLAGGVLAIAVVALVSLTVVPAVPWAPAKLGALLGSVAWLLRRSRRSVDPSTPTALDRLAGRVTPGRLAPLGAMPAAAATVYALAWPLRRLPLLTGATYWLFVAGQVAAGVIALGWAARRSLSLTATAQRVASGWGSE